MLRVDSHAWPASSTGAYWNTTEKMDETVEIVNYNKWLSIEYFYDCTCKPFWIRYRNLVFAFLGLVVVTIFSIMVGFVFHRLVGIDEEHIILPLSGLLILAAIICYAFKTNNKPK